MQKIVFFVVVFLMSISAFSQQEPQNMQEFINRMTPVFPGCEKEADRSECFRLKTGDLIVATLNEFNKTNPIAVNEIQIEIRLMLEVTGKTTVALLKTADSTVENVAKEALSKIPLMTPLSSEDGKPKTSSQRFFIRIKKNTASGNFEQVYGKKANVLQQASPNLNAIKSIVFPGCETVSEAERAECFKKKFGVWISDQTSVKDFGNFSGEKAIIRIVFQKEGTTTSSILSSSSEALKISLLKVLQKIPRVQPATLEGETISESYTIPLQF